MMATVDESGSADASVGAAGDKNVNSGEADMLQYTLGNEEEEEFHGTLEDLETLEGLERLEALADNEANFPPELNDDPFESSLAPLPFVDPCLDPDVALDFDMSGLGSSKNSTTLSTASTSASSSASTASSALQRSDSSSGDPTAIVSSVSTPTTDTDASWQESGDRAGAENMRSPASKASSTKQNESKSNAKAKTSSKIPQSQKNDDDEQNGGGSPPGETSQERKERMAAACRRFRAKRKLEIASLQERNRELELARTEYQHRIADLQLEAQMLRGEGEVHLRKENELLRVEIRRYKRFIQTIADAASSASKVQPEEKYRLLCEGIESASGQVMGLLYTSVRDSSWCQAHTVTLGEIPVTVKYQHLPLGTSAIAATRTNLRLDVVLAIPPEQAYKAIWESWLSFNIVQEFVKKHVPGIKATQEELEPDFGGDGQWNDENVKIVRFTETLGHNVQDSIHAYTRWEDQVVFPAGFYDHPDSGLPYSPVPDGPQKAKIVMQSCGEAITKQAVDIAPPEEGVDRIKKTMLEAYVIRPGPNGGSFWTGIVSFPNVGCTIADVEPTPFALDDGTISSQGLAYFGIQRDIIRSHGSLSDMDNDCAMQ
ncbi:Hypothetical Protein FCC1311_107782 [Hondaea fermentalgiana]|uniref:BZIP domain-containing protein n=1 Tax=Hondaea fermentalgiana TaxID=2315210 RepID=A0A2R5H2D4_9STRA|nr:Hypothetical Protein FCC1311_107782 [Hondaea fermentalgiana]|eukprot:GBG34554.1 Hypothetical Protein FCC1311_107782 [Hondaea fermentalgiana]